MDVLPLVPEEVNNDSFLNPNTINLAWRPGVLEEKEEVLDLENLESNKDPNTVNLDRSYGSPGEVNGPTRVNRESMETSNNLSTINLARRPGAEKSKDEPLEQVKLESKGNSLNCRH